VAFRLRQGVIEGESKGERTSNNRFFGKPANFLTGSFSEKTNATVFPTMKLEVVRNGFLE
jgi:hypothetical protein